VFSEHRRASTRLDARLAAGDLFMAADRYMYAQKRNLSVAQWSSHADGDQIMLIEPGAASLWNVGYWHFCEVAADTEDVRLSG
jgi:hypothetical protein